MAELAPASAWLFSQLGLVDSDGSVARDDVRALGEFLVRFGALPAATNGNGNGSTKGSASNNGATRKPRQRKSPTKAQRRSELTDKIARLLMDRPGSTVREIADALGETVENVNVAVRPVDWLVLGDNELSEPLVRIESDAIVATRERARAALQAASLLTSPLSHQAYTTLVREGRIKGPSVARIVQLFGSWTNACAQVGVSSGEPLRSNYERRWTADDLLGYVERFLNEPAYKGASHQFDVWRATVNGSEKVPSLGTVRNVVGGTWNDIRTTALRRMRARWSDRAPVSVSA